MTTYKIRFSVFGQSRTATVKAKNLDEALTKLNKAILKSVKLGSITSDKDKEGVNEYEHGVDLLKDMFGL